MWANSPPKLEHDLPRRTLGRPPGVDHAPGEAGTLDGEEVPALVGDQRQLRRIAQAVVERAELLVVPEARIGRQDAGVECQRSCRSLAVEGDRDDAKSHHHG